MPRCGCLPRSPSSTTHSPRPSRDIPEHLDDICRRLLQMAPRDRYQSAQEILYRLEAEERDAAYQLFADDQQRQRREDLRRMGERLVELGDEERRELDAVRTRYAEVRPFVSTAAVVFAISQADAARRAGG